ncbi:MAG TPA: hypothetical protein VL651_04115 [Bacteroidia bacterium]|jgi:hypothetical protein|nr:hypothetical protein [Bacteroidia bacterium]
MKKHFFFFFSLLSCSFCFSQNATAIDYKWGIGLQINQVEKRIPILEDESATGWDDGYLYNGSNHRGKTTNLSFALGLVAVKMNEQNMCRIRFGVDRIDIKLNCKGPDASSGTSFINETAFKRRTDYLFSPGWGLILNKDRINFYVGLEVPIRYYSAAQLHYYYETGDLVTGVVDWSNEILAKNFSAFSLGIGNFVGFNYELKQWRFGGELSYAFTYSRRLSKSTFDVIDINYQSGTNTSSHLDFEPKISEIGLSGVQPSFIISFSF